MRNSHQCGHIFLVLLLLMAQGGAFVLMADDARLIEIVADGDNRFHVVGEKTPVVRAHPGEHLRLRITAHRGQEMGRDGAVHSLVVRKLRAEGWDFRLHEGTQEFAVDAPSQEGEYLAECTVKCGRGHDDMHLRLLVKQQ